MTNSKRALFMKAILRGAHTAALAADRWPRFTQRPILDGQQNRYALIALRLITFLLALTAALVSHAAEPLAESPGWYRAQIGRITVTALWDGTLEMPVNEVFKKPGPAQLKALLARHYLTPAMPMSVNAFVIDTGQRSWCSMRCRLSRRRIARGSFERLCAKGRGSPRRMWGFRGLGSCALMVAATRGYRWRSCVDADRLSVLASVLLTEGFYERLRGEFLRPTHHFGMKAHIGVDADPGLVHSLHLV